MPVFEYIALDKKNKKITGEIKKENKQKAIQHLKANSLIIIKINRKIFLKTDIKDIILKNKKITKTDMSWFCRQMSFMILSGMSISNCLETILGQTKNKKLEITIRSVNEEVLKGESLNKSMEKTKEFSVFLTNMIKVGELTSSLDGIFLKMAIYYEKQNKYEQEIKGAMIYPTIVSIMMFFVIVVAVVFVVPNYSNIFFESGIELPLPTKILIALSSFIVKYIYLIMFFTILAIIAFVLLLRTEKFNYYKDYFLLNFPFIKFINIKTINYKFSTVLNIMIGSGVSITESLNVASVVIDNKIMTIEMKNVISKIEQGKTLSTSIKECKYFDVMIYSMLKIGEETGFISKTMETCSDYFQFEMDILIVKLNKLIEPIITIVLGLILGFIMLAIMLPTFELTNTI